MKLIHETGLKIEKKKCYLYRIKIFHSYMKIKIINITFLAKQLTKFL